MTGFEDDESERPTIFGNEKVAIERDDDARVWHVKSAGPERQHLATIPWAHALKEWPHAKDYGVAVKTCMASEVALTDDELAEEMAREELRAMGVDPDASKDPERDWSNDGKWEDGVQLEPDLPANVVPFQKPFPKRGR